MLEDPALIPLLTALLALLRQELAAWRERRNRKRPQ